jgi:hypothetical protein
MRKQNETNSDPNFEITPTMWAIWSMGPDRKDSWGYCLMFGIRYLNSRPAWGSIMTYGALYDATNGTISVGDIVRIGP